MDNHRTGITRWAVGMFGLAAEVVVYLPSGRSVWLRSQDTALT